MRAPAVCDPPVRESATGHSGQPHVPDRARLWKMALKPPIYAAACMTVSMAAAGVYVSTGHLPWQQALWRCVNTASLIAWLNLSNDYYDAVTGVDVNKHESVVNLTGNRPAVGVLAAVFWCIWLAGWVAPWVLYRDHYAVCLGFMSMACGYVYQAPPFRLAYLGLGEPLCVIAGACLVASNYLTMLSGLHPTASPALSTISIQLPPFVWACSAASGLGAATILLTSHFHQIDGDRAAGKISPLVRMGPTNGLRALHAMVMITYAVLVAGGLPWPALVAAAASLPWAHELLSYARQHFLVLNRIAILKKYACAWFVSLGVSLSVGLVLSRWVGVTEV